MTYFKAFPLTTYELNGEESVVTDILRRVRFMSEWKTYADLYTPHMISEGETPQTLAMEFYGAATYHWIILIFNEIHNPYFEWPMDTRTLIEYCRQKYGESTMYMTRHYESNGNIIGEVKEFNTNVPWVHPVQQGEHLAVSFFDYEDKLNEEKRIIKIMRPELLGSFVSQFEGSING